MIPTIERGHLDLLKNIQALAGDQPVYLVGGAVRDLLLGQNPKDLDFVLPTGSIALAKTVKKSLHGVWYALDDARQTARVLLNAGKPEERILDFVSFTGATLEEDLRNRDYTVNAMALSLSDPQSLIDPLNGKEALNSKVLRVASPDSILLDPLRAFRSIRMMRKFMLKPDEQTLQLISQGAAGMAAVSGERIRDELLKLLEIPDFSQSLRLMREVGLMESVFPDIRDVLTFERFPPHVHDLWEHTLQVILYVESLATGFNPNPSRDLTGGHLQKTLEAFKPLQAQICKDLNTPLQAGRKRVLLLLLAALYHDAGKAASKASHPDGRIHFREHPNKGSAMIAGLSEALFFGLDEAKYLQLMVAQHMRIHFLAKGPEPLSRRSIYRYYQELAPFGVDLALLSLADMLAAHEEAMDPIRWPRELELSVQLVDAWYSKQSEIICPPKLLDGDDLMRVFSLQPGPLLGQILSNLREAQAEGLVNTEQEAYAFCEAFIDGARGEKPDAS